MRYSWGIRQIESRTPPTVPSALEVGPPALVDDGAMIPIRRGRVFFFVVVEGEREKSGRRAREKKNIFVVVVAPISSFFLSVAFSAGGSIRSSSPDGEDACVTAREHRNRAVEVSRG